jgi:glutamate N-acetyltransferase/amino-acid N-acetyltransferase
MQIIIAVGRSGERADRDRLSISVGGLTILNQGSFIANLDAGALEALMADDVVDLVIDVGVSNGAGTVWTSDSNRRAAGRAPDRAF